MIFFAGNDGTIIKTFPSPVYQGAANTNTIYLIAPFASDLNVTVAFQLPTGVWTAPALMTKQNELEGIVSEKDGKTYSGWTYALPNEITKYYGTVNVQFFFYTAQSGVITALSMTSFPVSKGVPAVLPPTPTQDIYQQILSVLSALEGDLTGGTFAARSLYAWNSTYTYGINELVYYPNQGDFGVFLKSLTENNTQAPYVDGALNSQYWKVITDFNELNEIAEAQDEIFQAAAEAKADAASAESSATSAGNAAQNASQSAQAAQQAAESVKGLQDDIEGILDGTVAVSKAISDGTGANIAEHFAEIESLIPSSTTPENQLANEAFVNSSINNMAAFYITSDAAGTAFATHAALIAATTFYSGGKVRVPTQNDYAIVLADETQPRGADGNYPTTRYSYQTENQGGVYPDGQWDFQYVVNNTSLTQAQVNAINSGITAQKIASMDAATAAKYTKPTGGIPESDLSSGVQSKLNATSSGYIKNLFNKGVYDTSVSNGDGTATITRKTGFKTLNGNEYWFLLNGKDSPYQFAINDFPQDAAPGVNSKVCVSATIPTFSADYLYNNAQQGMSLSALKRLEIRITGITTVNDLKSYLRSNNIDIQYELASEYQYTETVIDDTPIHTLNQDGERRLRNEWEKGLNLFDINKIGYTDGISLGSNGQPYADANGYVTGYVEINPNTRYTFYPVNWIDIYDENKTYISQVGNLTDKPFTFTSPSNAKFIRFSGNKNFGYNIMLVEGSHPYPYEPYYGGIVRESELATVAKTGSYNDLTDKPTIPHLYAHHITLKYTPTGAGGFVSGSFTILDSNSDDLTSAQILAALPEGNAGVTAKQTGISLTGISSRNNTTFNDNVCIYKSNGQIRFYAQSGNTGYVDSLSDIDTSSSDYNTQATQQIF